MTGEIPIDARLADLQRSVEVGFATMKGEMALFSERDRVAEALHGQQAEDNRTLKQRVDALDRKVARAAGLAIGVSGALSATSGLIIWMLSHH